MIPIVIHGVPYSEECVLWSTLCDYLGIIDPSGETGAFLLICRWEVELCWLLGLLIESDPLHFSLTSKGLRKEHYKCVQWMHRLYLN